MTARFLGLAWVLATIAVNVTALAGLLEEFGVLATTWHGPFAPVSGLYNQFADHSFGAISGWLKTELGWQAPMWALHVLVLYASTASAILASGIGISKRESFLDGAKSAWVSSIWPLAVPLFLWDAIRMFVVSRFAREHALIFLGYLASIGAAYGGALHLNAQLAPAALTIDPAANPTPVEPEANQEQSLKTTHSAQATSEIIWLKSNTELDRAQRALAIAEDTFGPGRLNAAISFNNLTTLYTSQTRNVHATNAISSWRNSLARAHHRTSQRPNNHILPIAVESEQDAQDPDHATWLEFLSQANSLWDSGDVEQAVARSKMALRFAEDTFGHDDLRTVTSQVYLAGFHIELGQLDEAERLLFEALETSQRIVGPDHLDTARIQSELGWLLFIKDGREAEAQSLLQSALATQETALGDDHPDTYFTLSGLGILFTFQGELTAAENLLERALSSAGKIYGSESPPFAEANWNLAILYEKQNRIRQAITHYGQAIEIFEASQGLESIDAIFVKLDLAIVYFKQGNYAKAEPLLEQVVAVLERVYGPSNLDTVYALGTLALTKKGLGANAEAEALFRRAIPAYEIVYGKDDPNYPYLLFAFGELYFSQGDYSQAEPLLAEALRLQEAQVASDDLLLAAPINHLASVYLAQGRYEEALPLFERALSILRRELGPNAPAVANNLSNIGIIYVYQGRYAAAEKMLLEGLAVSEVAYGAEHPVTALILNNLGVVYSEQARFDEAERVLVRSLAVREKVLGPEDQDVAETLGNLALVYVEIGRESEAEPLLIRTLSIAEKAYPPEHPSIAAALNNLGDFYRRQGRYNKAETLLLQALSIYEAAYSSRHISTLTILNNLGALYIEMERPIDAEKIYLRVIPLAEEVLGPDHPNLINLINNLAIVYGDLGKSADAESLLLQAIALARRILGPSHPGTAGTLTNLGMHYFQEGKPSEAEPYLEEALIIRTMVLGVGHTDTVDSIENYFTVRALPGTTGNADGHAMSALIEAVQRFDLALRGSDISKEDFEVRFSYPHRATRILSAFERARIAEIEGSDAVELGQAAFLLNQLFLTSSAGDALEAAAARLRLDDSRLAELDAQRATISREIDRIRLQIERQRQISDANPGTITRLEDELRQLEGQRIRIAEAIQIADAGYAEVSGLAVFDPQSALDDDEALVVFASSGSGLFYMAFVVRPGWQAPVAIALGVDRIDIARMVRDLRKGLRLGSRFSGGWTPEPSGDPADLPIFDLELAQTLYHALFAPIESALTGASKLLIVADGPLQSLPFSVVVREAASSVLPTYERYRQSQFLVDHFAVTTYPSVSSLQTLRHEIPRALGARPLLAYGDPVLLPAQDANSAISAKPSASAVIPLGGEGNWDRIEDLPEVPVTGPMLEAVGTVLGARPDEIRLRDDAQEQDIWIRNEGDRLKQFRLIAFATHALVSNEIEALDLQEPALVMSRPGDPEAGSASVTNDGLLRASEIVDLVLDADMVILAACNTAAADGSPGAEPLSGLAKAFLYGGTRSLLVSHWQADANSTAVLVPDMVTRAEEEGFATALQLAKRDLRMNAKGDRTHFAHPAIWGPFTLVGEPR